MYQNFSDKIQTKKGEYGEKIVDEYLQSKGFNIYKTFKENKPHAFDRLAVKNKRNLIIAEVKSKAKMNRYNATGIDERHFNEYQYISQKYNIEVWLFFVDESPAISSVYGNKLSALTQKSTSSDGRTYPMHMNSWNPPIILFDYDKMVHVKRLEENDRKTLQQMSSRSYNYL